MIRKVINDDLTFGANYDEELKDEYVRAGIYPETNYIELTKEQAAKIDEAFGRYVYKEGVPGLFLGYPMGVVEKENWEQEQLNQARLSKYAEITESYDYANKYYVCNLYNDVYGNVSWIATWNKVIELCEANHQTTIPSDVRFYQKSAGSSKFKNIFVSEVSLSDLKRYKSLLDQVQFNILQPKRNNFYKQLDSCTTIAEIDSLKINYGFTLNEQDISDVNEKVEL